MDTMQDNIKRATRRLYSEAFRRQVLIECEQPGATVTRVALSHQMNPNVIRKWRLRAGAIPVANEVKRAGGQAGPGFVKLDMAPGASTPGGTEQFHLQWSRGALTASVVLPLVAMPASVGWLRELLREVPR